MDGSLELVPDFLLLLLDPRVPAKKRLDALLCVVEFYEADWFLDLLDLLQKDDEVTEVRASVAMSLCKLAGNLQSALSAEQRQLVVASVRALQSDENPMLRRYAVLGLPLTGSDDTIPWVVGALKDPDLDVFHSAAEALGRYGREVVPHLLTVLAQGADDAQCVAAWKLGELGFDEAIEGLIARLAVDAEPASSDNLKALCVWALGEIGVRSQPVLTALHQAERSTVPEISNRAQWALKKIARNWN